MSEQLQITQFEKNYIHRTTGNITMRPDIALTELIANAWDACAVMVNITLPVFSGDEIIIEDDGTGMTEEEFKKRWLTLAYNRLEHQGKNVETTPERQYIKRIAYGKNGVGRHGMLCFADYYNIKTWKNGKCIDCDISLDSGNSPISIDNYKVYDKAGHGTILKTNIKEINFNENEIREILSARYLYDPEFRIFVNGLEVNLEDHSGLILNEEIKILNDQIKLKIYIIDSSSTATKSKYHGVAFWVNKRLVGEPSWSLGNLNLKDGRTKFAKTHTIIIESDDLIEYVLPDWTNFKDVINMQQIYTELYKYLSDKIKELNKEKITDMKIDLIREHRNEISNLNRGEKMEIEEFINQIVEEDPDISQEELNIAVSTIINIKQNKNGIELLKKISDFTYEDIDLLNKILDNWNIKEIADTLDVIDYRISVIETISRICSDKNMDELHTLHPLIEQARWLFGPEFDSDEYTSNKSLSTIIREYFKTDGYKYLDNPRKRPDLLLMSDMSISCYSCSDIHYDSELFEIKNILIIELKKGGFSIGRKEVNQADDYVQEIAFKGGLINKPHITAYVVGDKIDSGISTKKILEDANGVIYATTYASLVETAKRRLFNLRKILSEKYNKSKTEDLISKVLREPDQQSMKI